MLIQPDHSDAVEVQKLLEDIDILLIRLKEAEKRIYTDKDIPLEMVRYAYGEIENGESVTVLPTAREWELHTMKYSLYLQTPEWRKRRLIMLHKAGHKCRVCNASNCTLNVHHRDYTRRGYELDSDLIVLCQECHTLFHDNGMLAF